MPVIRRTSVGSPRRRRTGLGTSAFTAAALLVGGAVSPPAAADADQPAGVTVRLDPGYQQQPFEGWGTSLAWFGHVTGGWPEAQRNRLADALYGAGGLGFTIARYNIGGGDSPETEPYMRVGAAVPGHWNRPGPETPNWWNPEDPSHWNPDADPNQRWWLRAAKARGADTFEAFSNSPPYFMTNSGLVSGAANPDDDNLRSDQYERFAAYLSGALRRVQDSTGVTFGSVSPVNEPSTDYWRAGGRQEGSHWAIDSQTRMITALRAELDAKGLRTPIAAMDETNPDLFRTNWDAYGVSARSAVGTLNTHTYGTNGRTGPRDIAKGSGIPLRMSEVDLGGRAPQSFTDMSPALDLAGRITDDLKELEPRAWVLWQAVEDYENMTPAHENSNWGLIQADFTPADAAKEPLRKNKKYWAMAQYSRFIRPGARVISTDDDTTLAAVRPGGQGAVVVHTNPTGAGRTVTLDLGGFRKVSPQPVKRYTTDATKNVHREADLATTGQRLTVTVGPNSVTTLVVPGASGVNAEAAAVSSAAPRLLVNSHSGMALSGAAAGGAVVQHVPNHGDAAQQWVLARTVPGDWSSTAAYRVTNVGSGKVLGVVGGTLALVPPGPSIALRWMLSTTGDGQYTLVNSATGTLLDVTGASTADGAPVGVHRPTTGSNQTWDFRRGPADWQALRARHSGKCLDVTGASTAEGAPVTQYTCNGGTHQQWSLRTTTDGHVSVVVRHSGMCLDVTGGSTADGAPVTQYTCGNGPNQQWSVRPTGGGYFRLVARHSGRCLDVSGASAADGASAVQYTCNGGVNQEFRTG
ncbi:RICIN domain-containing protein [Streptomyces sp. NPDC006512]|uniref:RICIN domain-containing protein n=1 Tax=Streptomyces sp. NPDC006512 TaxID=3154307 RepID=UPI0033A1155A